MIDKARLAAYNAAKRIFGGAYSNLITVSDELNGIDRAFAEHIALGTAERKLTLEYILGDFIRSDTKNELVTLLMTAVYQIMYMSRVPDNAVCDETVKLTKKLFGQKEAGFANAVLRNICRSKDNIHIKLDNAEEHIKYSVKRELFDMLKQQYPSDYCKIFDAFFGKPPLFLRVNTIKAVASDIADKVNGSEISDTAVLCDNPQIAIDLIDSGDFYVQGLASQKAVRLLDAQSGMTIIDVCACPGGKSLGAAIDMKNEGKILSFDLHKNKLPLIEKSAKRLGISVITTDTHDARTTRAELLGTADRVICDVPCSGTGVMGSKPEIKYKSPDDFEGLYPTQMSIIAAASKYLKVGGSMVYSTCSINKKENEEVVKAFLIENDGFRLIHEETCLPFNAEKEGFYMAKIKREF